MHSISLPYLWEAIRATVVFALYMVPPGFAVCAATNVAGFRQMSLAEKLAWAVALSYPLDALAAVLLGHISGPLMAQTAVLLLALAGIVVALRTRKTQPSRSGNQRLWLVLFAAAAFCLAATLPILIHGRLEEGVLSNDWYIRLPLQYAARISGVPPVNPLFTLLGRNPAQTYYYFFNVFCSLPMRLGALDPRGTLIAGTVWACIAYFAVAWLLLKYLAMPAAESLRCEGESRLMFRSQAMLFAGISLVGGLDLIPNLGTLALGGRLYPTLFWWNGESISPWPGTLPFVPHHSIGLSTALLGYLLLTLEWRRSDASHASRAAISLIASICFAAAIGTSTFAAVAVLAAVALLALDALHKRRAQLAANIAASLALALALDASFLRSILGGHADSATTSPQAHFPLKLVLHNWHAAYGTNGQLMQRILHTPQGHGIRTYLATVPMLLLLYAIDLGFFWFVLWNQLRRDTARNTSLSVEARSLWWLFLSCATLACFVSSSPLQHGLNDLGRHTATAARMVLMLWACPLVAQAWHKWRRPAPLPARTRLVFGAAALCALLGVAGCAWDVTVQRLYLPLVDSGRIHPRDPFLFAPGIGFRYTEMSQAWQAINAQTPPDAIVQTNPDGPLQRPILLYINRRVAAGDISCETAFGGSQADCRSANVLPLLSLYAQPETGPDLQTTFDTSPRAFASVCAASRLSALIVTDYDPVWSTPSSWVWTGDAIYAGRYVRVLRCPPALPVAQAQ